MIVQLRRIWIQLTSDRTRFGVLCAAVGVALLLWARIIVISNTPRTAVADDVAESERLAELSDETVGDETSMQGESRVQVVRLVRRPHRDPFVISNEHFPKPNDGHDGAQEQDKSHAQMVEDSEARITASLQAKVDGLTLEAVMSGPPPMAVIDGMTYRIGDEVPTGEDGRMTFTLFGVGQRRVWLEQGEHQFVLKMPTPTHR